MIGLIGGLAGIFGSAFVSVMDDHIHVWPGIIGGFTGGFTGGLLGYKKV